MAREDLFTVVIEHFMTDTADHADYVLPATTQLEHWDIHGSYGHTDVLLNRLPATDPATELLREIHKPGERAAGLTRQLLALSRRQIIEAKVPDLNALAGDDGQRDDPLPRQDPPQQRQERQVVAGIDDDQRSCLHARPQLLQRRLDQRRDRLRRTRRRHLGQKIDHDADGPAVQPHPSRG